VGYLTEAVDRWTFQGIANASVSVDTFFVLRYLEENVVPKSHKKTLLNNVFYGQTVS
jgi:hypothetical protein